MSKTKNISIYIKMKRYQNQRSERMGGSEGRKERGGERKGEREEKGNGREGRKRKKIY